TGPPAKSRRFPDPDTSALNRHRKLQYRSNVATPARTLHQPETRARRGRSEFPGPHYPWHRRRRPCSPFKFLEVPAATGGYILRWRYCVATASFTKCRAAFQGSSTGFDSQDDWYGAPHTTGK